jgi:hypothetical protein
MPDYRLATRRAAKKFGVDPALLEALVQQESGFNPNAKSPAGAQGIAQFMPGTAPGYGVNLHDNRVTDDLEGAAKYIAANLKRTGGNVHQALSIYNSGKPEGYKTIPETRNYVARILAGAKGFGGSGGTGPSPSPAQARTTSVSTPGVDNSAARAALVQQFLGSKSADPVDFALGIRGAQDVPGRNVSSNPSSASPSSSSGVASQLKSRADTIDKQRLPYKWGGGHQGKTPIGQAVPLDCSGAVSKVLGIDPRVASQFKSFGQPGEGGQVTIYAKDTHVLMSIRGQDGQMHFFGTSATNPGGGAGWIPRSAISPGYLKGFTARHA